MTGGFAEDKSCSVTDYSGRYSQWIAGDYPLDYPEI